MSPIFFFFLTQLPSTVLPTNLRGSHTVRVTLFFCTAHVWSGSRPSRSACETLSSSSLALGVSCLSSFCPTDGSSPGVGPLRGGGDHLLSTFSGAPGCTHGTWERWDPSPLGGHSGRVVLEVPRLEAPHTRLDGESVYTAGLSELRDP